MKGGGGKQGARVLSSEDPNPDSGSLGELPGEGVGIPVGPRAPGERRALGSWAVCGCRLRCEPHDGWVCSGRRTPDP